MIRALPRSRIALVRIADDAESRLVNRDANSLDSRRIVKKLRMLHDEVNESGNRAGRLMLIQPELEMHTHHGEIVAAGRQLQVKWTYPLCLLLCLRRLQEAKHCLRIPKDVSR